MGCPVKHRVSIKTGAHGGFRMVYVDPRDPIHALSLDDVEIHISFINPRTRIVLFSAYIGHGIEVLDEACGLFIVEPGDTSKWPLGEMPFDIRYTKGGASQYTETIYLDVKCGYSQGQEPIYIRPIDVTNPGLDPAEEEPGEFVEPVIEEPECIPPNARCTSAASKTYYDSLTEETS